MIYPSRTDIPSWYKLNVLVPKDEHGVKIICLKLIFLLLALQHMLKDKPTRHKYCLTIHLNTQFMPRHSPSLTVNLPHTDNLYVV